ncbi:MAG: hypothetical protein LUC97_01540 [Clostridiales bacterium]|nr:hypothetical protein [Clostridiales bacterium]
MGIGEISRRYSIDIEKLRIFEDNKLIAFTESFNDEDLNRLGDICSLYDSGLSAEEIKMFMTVYDNADKDRCIKFLTVCRNNLLEEIHKKQKCLDNLDFMIYEIKNTKTSIF